MYHIFPLFLIVASGAVLLVILGRKIPAARMDLVTDPAHVSQTRSFAERVRLLVTVAASVRRGIRALVSFLITAVRGVRTRLRARAEAHVVEETPSIDAVSDETPEEAPAESAGEDVENEAVVPPVSMDNSVLPAPVKKKRDIRRQKPATLSEKVAALVNRGRVEKAEQLLLGTLRENPRLAEAYHALAELYMKVDRSTDAQEVYEELVKRHPSDAGAWGTLGRLYSDAGELTRAIEALQKAHNADERNTTYLELLLNIAHHMDSEPLQRVTLEKLAELQPDNEEVQEKLTALARAREGA